MRQQPATTPLQALLAALPDARLAALVTELARANGPAATETTGFDPSTSAREPSAAIDDPHKAAVADARRVRKNAARTARRAAARLAKAGTFEKPSGGIAHAPAPNTAGTGNKTNNGAAAAPPGPAGTPTARKAPAPAPPKFSIAKDAETGRHALFLNDKPIGDFATRDAAERARNLALIKNTAAHRPAAGPRPHAAPPG